MVFIILGVSGQYLDNHIARFKFPYNENYVFDNKLLQKQSWSDLIILSNDPSYSVSNNKFDNQLWFTDNSKKNIVLVGNSHSADLYNAFMSSEKIRKDFNVGRYGIEIRDLRNMNSAFYRSPNYLASHVTMIVTRFNDGLRNDTKALPTIINRFKRDNKIVVIVGNTIEFDDYSPRNLSDYIILNKLKYSNKLPINPAELISEINLTYFKSSLKNNNRESRNITKINQNIRDISQKFDVLYLDRSDYICEISNQICFGVSPNMQKLFYDYGHTTMDGAVFFGKRIDKIGWLDPVIKKLGSSSNFLQKRSTP